VARSAGTRIGPYVIGAISALAMRKQHV